MTSVLIAPDSFKGTLTAHEVCEIIGKAISKTVSDAKITMLPAADGGEGLCACFSRIADGEFISCEVSGVFGEKMNAEYYMLKNATAVIEMASCAGLMLAENRLNPEKTTTLGVGEMIQNAVSRGAKQILLGLGGSATNDCAMGMASALGWKFLDENGKSVYPSGDGMGKVRRIIKPEKTLDIPVVCACDVDNPLFGKTGAAYVFAAQKGADEQMIERLDGGLRNMACVIKNDLGIDVSSIPGGGAAGGMGAGSVAFLGAELKRGIDIILDEAQFDEKARNADLIITGEGKLDFQSVDGKVISGIAKRAAKLGKRVITICGCRGEGAEKILELGVEKMFFSSETKRPFEEVLATCRQDLYSAAVKAIKDIM